MKKSTLIYCLLALGTLWSACDPRKSDQGISLSAHEICDPATKDKQGCLPLDDQHAVMITVQDGRPQLHPLPAESMQFGREKGFGQFGAELLRSEQGHRFTPEGTRMVIEKDALVFTSAQQENEFRVPFIDPQGGFTMLLSQGDAVVVTTFSSSASGNVDCSKPIDLTDKISGNSDNPCARITVLENICFTSLGVAEILDNAIDPDLLVRIRFKEDWLKDIFKGRPEIGQNPTAWMEFSARGFQKPIMAKPQASRLAAPLHFANNPTPGDAGDGGCKNIEFQISSQICRFRLGDKRIIYCDHALHSADDAAGTNKSLILTLNQQGCDLCLSREGDCVVISATSLSTCTESNFCSSLEPCTD